MSKLVAYFKEREKGMVEHLCELVGMESFSQDKYHIDSLSSHIGEMMALAGARVEQHPLQVQGNMILGYWGESCKKKPILIIGHLDTVWPVGTLNDRPIQIKDGKLYGPGAYDMKAGVVIAINVIGSMRDLGLSPVAPVIILFTGDEETGSHGSRDMIEQLAAKSQLVLCLEPALPGGALKTSRKGIGNYVIKAHGRASHAGGDHQKGVSAIEEMAHQVIKLQGLTDYTSGTTVNVGVISGGSADNVVPADCTIKVDFRVASFEGVGQIASAMEVMTPYLSGARLEISGGLERPPMERNELMIHTYRRAKAIAQRHGIILEEGGTGGGSDANFTANLGIPSLDGLGADGDGAHANHEHVIIKSLPERAALLAAILTEWA